MRIGKQVKDCRRGHLTLDPHTALATGRATSGDDAKYASAAVTRPGVNTFGYNYASIPRRVKRFPLRPWVGVARWPAGYGRSPSRSVPQRRSRRPPGTSVQFRSQPGCAGRFRDTQPRKRVHVPQLPAGTSTNSRRMFYAVLTEGIGWRNRDAATLQLNMSNRRARLLHEPKKSREPHHHVRNVGHQHEHREDCRHEGEHGADDGRDGQVGDSAADEK